MIALTCPDPSCADDLHPQPAPEHFFPVGLCYRETLHLLESGCRREACGALARLIVHGRQVHFSAELEAYLSSLQRQLRCQTSLLHEITAWLHLAQPFMESHARARGQPVLTAFRLAVGSGATAPEARRATPAAVGLGLPHSVRLGGTRMDSKAS